MTTLELWDHSNFLRDCLPVSTDKGVSLLCHGVMYLVFFRFSLPCFALLAGEWLSMADQIDSDDPWPRTERLWAAADCVADGVGPRQAHAPTGKYMHVHVHVLWLWHALNDYIWKCTQHHVSYDVVILMSDFHGLIIQGHSADHCVVLCNHHTAL